ncbi:MAG: hypothetical protein KDE09_05525 [Anaerolineales bacterium]|nr:hypothetical protein [Anaerolineales bacterium]MCB0008411.1 hypothetical protein [Anaerolineales bacterium]MCB0013700.1 hypothetical protein [Anaerolineales bacterium]MCB0017231.1 hypothetical protein [Anaerolineales bacterium]MCB0030463.1 hypothetical protein [Anaerolineales bacterium]
MTTKNQEKKAYEKPAVVHRQLLESVAGACEAGDPINGKTGSGDTCTVANS